MTGIWAGGSLLVGIALGVAGWPVLLIMLPLAWFALRGGIRGPAQRVAVLIGLVGLTGLGMARTESVDPPPSLLNLGTVDRLEGQIVSPVQTDLRSQHFEVRLSRVRVDDVWSDQAGTVRVTAPTSPRLGFGDDVGLTGDLVPSEDSEPGYRSYLEQQRVSGSFYGRSVWVERSGTGFRRGLFGFGAELAERLRRAVPGDSGILLGGLVVGDDSALSDDLKDAFRETGMSHITAVSGSNLALVVVLLMAVGHPLRLRRRLPWLLIVTIAVWLYAAVTGLESPVVRAALMATIALLAIPFGRRPDYLTAAVISAAVMALHDPTLIRDTGFQLSLGASVALAAVAAGVSISSPSGGIRIAVNGAIIAQIATLPVTLVAFGTVSLVAIPLNLIIGPLVAVAFPIAFAGALLSRVSPPVGEAVMLAAGWWGDLILMGIDLFAGIPFASLAVPDPTYLARIGLLSLSVLAVVLVSADGRRWARRLLIPVRAA